MLWIHVLFSDSKIVYPFIYLVKENLLRFQIPVYSKPKFQKVIENNTLLNALISTLASLKSRKNEIWVKLNVHVVIDSVLFRSFLHNDILSSYYCFGIHCRLSATIRLRRGITGKLFGTYTRNQRNNNILNVRSQARLKVTEMGIWNYRKIAIEVHQAPICPHQRTWPKPRRGEDVDLQRDSLTWKKHAS